jgi:hypothetical protein
MEAPFFYIDFKLPNDLIVPKILAPQGVPYGCDILIGMDVITLGDFAVSNHNGKTVFTFQTPSQGLTDYVKQINTKIVMNKHGGYKPPPKRKH